MNTRTHKTSDTHSRSVAASLSHKKGEADDTTLPLQGMFEAPTRETGGAPDTMPAWANRTGLPDNLKAGVEALSGYTMNDVKVHYNSAKPAQLQAHAYAQGTDIHVAPGQERHLPHEAWHVVQQKQGRVKPTRQLKGKVNVNDDKDLESEADYMGNRARQATYSQTLQAKTRQTRAPEKTGNHAVQRVRTDPGENWIYHITPLATFISICETQAIVPLNTILDQSNPETVSSGLDSKRGENKHETKEAHEELVIKSKETLDKLEGTPYYELVKAHHEDIALGRKRDFVYGTLHAHRIDSYRNHYETEGERDDLVVLRWKGGEEEYHIDKQDEDAIKTLSGIDIKRCEVTRTVPRTDSKPQAKKVLDEAAWVPCAVLYEELTKEPS